MSAGMLAACGAAVVGGGATVAWAMCRRRQPLASALRTLDGEPPPSRAWAVPAPARQVSRLLAMQGRTIADFQRRRVAAALLAAAVAGVVAAVASATQLTHTWWWTVPLAAVAGFWWPSVQLRGLARRIESDAVDAVVAAADLAILERLANKSGAQALAGAAATSQAPAFVALREALTVAELRREPAWTALERLAMQWGLAQWADLARVFRLEDSGAQMAGILRAQLRQMRHAHLTALTLQAHADSERMTVWMVVPAVLFGAVFLAPAVLAMWM